MWGSQLSSELSKFRCKLTSAKDSEQFGPALSKKLINQAIVSLHLKDNSMYH